jgi:hypothetical protein
VNPEEWKIYLQCGVRVRSQLELHLPVVPGSEFDVDVRWGSDVNDTGQPLPGDDIVSYDLDDARWYSATATDGGYRMRFHECGEFEISSDLTQVVVGRDPAGRTELLPILMAGTVSAFLLGLRGHTVLHASAVSIGGEAVAFVGQSGRGKSTLAALLCLDGAELVTDDVLVVDAAEPVVCRGGSTELRLRAAAAPLAAESPPAATRTTADDRVALTAGRARADSLPLRTIVIPSPSRTATQVEHHVVDPSTALFRLLSIPRVFGWRDPDVLRRDFTALSKLVNQVPVYDVVIPWGPPFDQSVAPALARLVDGEASVSERRAPAAGR